MFAIFINGLIPHINSINNGITLDNEFSLNALLYADDIVLLSSNADGLQSQLDVLNNWSKCTLNVNIDKTKIVKDTLLWKHQSKWSESLEEMHKLRTYKHLKSSYTLQPCMKINISRQERPVIAGLRCGVFPLEIERERYRRSHVKRRLCKICKSGSIEDETHFVLNCLTYAAQR